MLSHSLVRIKIPEIAEQLNHFLINQSIIRACLGIGLIMSYVLQDLPSISERQPFGELSEFPLFFGTTLFAIEAVGVVVALENNMKTPKSFGARFGVLNIGMVVITLLYAFFGFLGYLVSI